MVGAETFPDVLVCRSNSISWIPIVSCLGSFLFIFIFYFPVTVFICLFFYSLNAVIILFPFFLYYFIPVLCTNRERRFSEKLIGHLSSSDEESTAITVTYERRPVVRFIILLRCRLAVLRPANWKLGGANVYRYWVLVFAPPCEASPISW